MIINHNLAANNSIRNANSNAINASKSMQKLSSGLRINGAADDAAGLAISEKMRGQIRGLDQASSNAQDGISLIQTAEGALSETQSILQRMRELAVQSSTDTNTADDRTKIQGEVDQLAKEITRVSNTTEFNTQNLLAGGLDDKFHIGANEGQNISLSINKMDASSLGVAADKNSMGTFTAGGTCLLSSNVGEVGSGLDSSKTYTIDVTHTNAGATVSGKTTVGTATVTLATAFSGSRDQTVQFKVTGEDGSNGLTAAQYSTDGGTTWSAANVSSNAITYNGVSIDLGTVAVDQTATVALTAKHDSVQLKDGTENIGNAVTVYSDTDKITIGDAASSRTLGLKSTTGVDLGNLATASSTTFAVNKLSSSAAVTTNGVVVTDAVVQAGINVSTQSAASSAITKINDAITNVSEERSKLGAYQNRLEHTIANLGTSSENLTSSESRIRDVDMAKEMSTFSKNNILSQAAQAMLAQANQTPQQVLQLLR